MRIVREIFICAVFLVFAGCHTPTQEETLLKDAFAAFKSGDWQTLSKDVKSGSDYDLKSQGLKSPLKQSMSYSSNMREEEMQRMHQAFIRVVSSTEAPWLNFKEAEYNGYTMITDTENTETIAGDSVPTKIYGFKLKDGSIAQYPKLAVAEWGSFLQIINIIVPEEEYEGDAE